MSLKKLIIHNLCFLTPYIPHLANSAEPECSTQTIEHSHMSKEVEASSSSL